MSQTHSDFELPGFSSRGLASWIVGVSFAYSGKWNLRNLENHFHAFWNRVLTDLVNDLEPDTIVIPQFQFGTLNDVPLALDESIAMTPQAEAKEIMPDFSIAIFHLVRRHTSPTLSIPPALFPATFDSWRDIQVRQMKIPLIAELKRPPTRHAECKEDFTEALIVQMQLAHADLLKQVEHAFLMQPVAKKIVLLACCREWWSWMIATRAVHVQEPVLQDLLKIEDEEESEVNITLHDIPESRTQEHLPHRTKNVAKGTYCDPPPSPPCESEKVPYKPRPRGSKAPGGEGDARGQENTKNVQFKRYTELKEGAMETVKPNVEDATPVDDEWSLPILFGSEASAQRLFLIHRFLEAEWEVRGVESQVSLNLYTQMIF
jgi:hypothetical protein